MLLTSKDRTKRALQLAVVLVAGVALPLLGGMLPDVFTDYRSQKPGATHRITVGDLPKPYATESSRNNARMIPRPADAWPQAPQGFKVDLYAAGLENPRLIRTAPNGDLFVAESAPGRIKIFRGITKDGKFDRQEVFATGLKRPFGIAFYPPGPNPKYVYIGNTDSVVRFPYQSGDMKARGPQEVIVPTLPSGGGHWTRDLAFSLDGKKLFIAVGSSSNVDEGGDGSREVNRACVLVANPDGSDLKIYASGIRNPAGIRVHPGTGEVWMSVNERDALGDNLPPDYISSIKEGGFYGWPWYYIGGNPDPRHQGKHPELKDKVIVPDLLLQAHSASLSIAFYDGKQFPAEYSGDLFAAEHGSWNKAVRQGSVVIRVPMKNGKATGEYTDFLTGFVAPNGDVWGRVVGVDVARDGSLLVSDDGSNALWRVSYVGK